MIGAMLKNIYRYSAVAAVVVAWIVFIVGMRQTGLTITDSRPLSYLGVSSFATTFQVALIATLVMLGLFYAYLQQRFKPTKTFRNVFFLGLLMQAIVAYTPYEIDGRAQWLHWTAATILALVLISLPWLFAASHNITESTKRISKSVTIVYVVVLVVETFLLIGPQYYAASELFNILIFDVWLLYLAFLSKNQSVNKPQNLSIT